MKKALSKAGKNEEKPNESTGKTNTGNTVAASVSDYIKHLTPIPLKSMNISPISLSIIPVLA